MQYSTVDTNLFIGAVLITFLLPFDIQGGLETKLNTTLEL